LSPPRLAPVTSATFPDSLVGVPIFDVFRAE